MAIESTFTNWTHLYEEVDRANVLLHDARSRLGEAREDKGRLAQDVERLTCRSNAALEALHDAYRAASSQH